MTTTPKEVYEWAENYTCPLCKNPLKQDDITITDKAYMPEDPHEYWSEISCVWPYCCYIATIEFTDPKNIRLVDEEMIIDGKDLTFTITIFHHPNNPSRTHIHWQDPYDDYVGGKLVFDEPIIDTKNIDQKKLIEQLEMMMLFK
jgi:hypothetical protein